MSFEHPGIKPNATIEELQLFLAFLRINPIAVQEYGEVGPTNKAEEGALEEIAVLQESTVIIGAFTKAS